MHVRPASHADIIFRAQSGEVSPLRSAVQHAFQELAALRACIERIKAVRSRVNGRQ